MRFAVWGAGWILLCSLGCSAGNQNSAAGAAAGNAVLEQDGNAQASGSDEGSAINAEGDHLGLPLVDAVTFEARTVLRASSDPRLFIADWTETPNYYLNSSGREMTLVSVEVLLDATPYDLGDADIDVCLALIGPDTTHMTVNGVETLCFAQHKSESSGDWPEPSVRIDLPGQGLLLPSNYHVACGAQGVTSLYEPPDTGRAEFSDITCRMTLDVADPSRAEPAVQSVRAPYIDQRFYSSVSGFAPHTNPTSTARPVLGLWSYVSSYATSLELCTEQKQAGGAWLGSCEAMTQSGSYHSDTRLHTPGYSFAPGDQIESYCTVEGGDQTHGTICAAYFFLAIPIGPEGGFDPLVLNETVALVDAEDFCHPHFPEQYIIPDPAIQADADLCMSLLAYEGQL